MSDALDQLRATGYAIGPDKLLRLSFFGIESTRRGRRRYLDRNALADLRYVLEIERRYRFARDRDGLCLELAYRGYPTVPWDRVHRGATDRVAAIFARIDRELHRAANRSGPGFHPRRISKLARQLAKHFIPTAKIAANPAYAIARDLVEQVAQVLLRVAYFGDPITERDLVRLLMTLGISEKSAMEYAPGAVPFVNSMSPMLRVNHSNRFGAILRIDPNEAQVQAAVQTMRRFPKIIGRMNAAGVAIAISPAASYPAIEDISSISAFDVPMRSLWYAAAIDVNQSEEGRRMLQRLDSGETTIIDQTIALLATTMSLVPKAIGVDDAK